MRAAHVSRQPRACTPGLLARCQHPEVIAFLGTMGENALDIMEAALTEEPWLAGSSPTIADISVYGYARLAEEAGYDLSARPALRAWRERVQALPGWGTPEQLMAVT